MPHLVQVGLKRAPSPAEAASFPFDVPAIRSLPMLDVEVPVTLFVGENGSGKSTLLEAIATAAELPALGGSEVADDDTLAHQRRLGELLRLAWRPRSRQGFFLRAEDFFGHLRGQARIDARISREKGFLGATEDRVAGGAGALHVDERNAAQFLRRYDSRSHGESFLDLFQRRIRPRGLYLMDEPEAPLSPMRQLEALRLIVWCSRPTSSRSHTRRSSSSPPPCDGSPSASLARCSSSSRGSSSFSARRCGLIRALRPRRPRPSRSRCLSTEPRARGMQPAA